MVRLQCRLDPFGDETVDLLLCPTGKALGIQQLIHLVQDWLEVSIVLDPSDQIVLPSVFFHFSCGLVRKDTDAFVAFLAVSTATHHGHNDVFGGHEGEFGLNTTRNDGGIDDKAFGNVLQDSEDYVGGEEGFGDGEATVGRVVEGTFHPLSAAVSRAELTALPSHRARPQTRSLRIGLRL